MHKFHVSIFNFQSFWSQCSGPPDPERVTLHRPHSNPPLHNPWLSFSYVSCSHIKDITKHAIYVAYSFNIIQRITELFYFEWSIVMARDFIFYSWNFCTNSAIMAVVYFLWPYNIHPALSKGVVKPRFRGF